MLPQVKNGDYVVLFTWLNCVIWPGMQAVFNHPDYGTLLKSVVKVNRKEKTFSAEGFSLHSIKTEQLKQIPIARIKGLVIWKLSPQ